MTVCPSDLTPGVIQLLDGLMEGVQESTSLRLRIVVHAFGLRTQEAEVGRGQESTSVKPEPW